MADKGFFSKVRQGVSELVTESEPAAGKGKTAAPASAKAGRAEAPAEATAPVGAMANKAQFDQQLGMALANHDEVSGGGLNLVGLTQLKERFGEQWPKLQDKAITLASRVIERHLTAGAFYKVVGEDQFVVCFPDLDEMQARLKTGLIAEKINDLLLGEDGERLVDTKSGAVGMDGSFVEKDEQETLLAMGVGGDASAQQAAKDTSDAAHTSSQEPPPDWLSAAPDLDAAPKIEEMGFIFRPMWCAAKSRVSTYLCKPAVALNTHTMAVGEQVFDFWDADTHGWKVDIATLKAAAKAAQDALIAGTSSGFAAPVHWKTVTNDTQRVRYLSEAWRFPEGVRKRLVLEVTGLPEHASDDMMRRVVQSLRPVCRAVILGVAPHWRQMDMARRNGIRLVGFDARHARLAEKHLIALLPQFAAAARRNKMGAYVHGLAKLSTTVAALDANYHFLDGDVVAPRANKPGEPFALDVESVYRRKLGLKSAGKKPARSQGAPGGTAKG